ncbi:TraG family conjugative transposon ATPase [Zobellia galactanivorans]|uniref:TraG family conjugative transposon ATPase n=1 Tax=Zobellia galactanivorans (strain DSM 12802 / CCUG 47099 / CIP 106680 / NCIMB 13871 / Dsij) TaxID=63186 RepID=UPI001C064B92|nr:TraG family conjugative transposon ATPase [Zobellia galactanivorans]MBU3027538.1 TraG family conjugative transposon ATPase [Zobellia galactanivorans]
MINKIEKIFPIYTIEEDLLISKFGDVSLVYELKMPQIYSLDKEAMDSINLIIDKLIGSLPPGTIMQKQDYFFVTDLKDPIARGTNMLSRSDNSYYFEKPILTHQCYLIFTKDSKNKVNITNNTTKYEKYLEGIDGFISDIDISVSFLSKEEYFSANRLNSDQIIDLLGKYFSLSSKSDNKLKDIFLDRQIQVGNKVGEVYAITSNNELPINIDSYVRNKEYSTQRTDFFIPYIQALCLGLECNHIFNQIVYIEKSEDVFKSIKVKMNNFKSLSLLSKENELNHNNIEDLVENVIDKELKFIKQHFNIIIWEDSKEKLEKSRNNLENIFREMGMRPYHIKYSIKDIFLNSGPGAATRIPEEYKFIGISEQTASLMNFESYYESFKDGILLCDRKNEAPIRLDLWDEPVQRGHIVNRNRLIFGPSGTGKSFLINHIASQYYEQGHHIVMIDIGNSYKKLCKLVGGQYYTYDVDHPMEFNPFYIHGEIDIDKKEFLVSLIMFLWKGESSFTKEEKQIITLYLDAYYVNLKVHTDIFPKLSTFYEFVMENRVEYNEEKYFDKLSFDLSVRDFYDGKYRHILNSERPVDLLHERFIVFEMDNIKDHPVLFPLITMLSIDVVMGKIRQLKGIKKSIFIDECWKPISKGEMAEFIKYMYKTVRKHYGEVAIATQDIEDILETSAGAAMINNTDTMILLSHKKKMASKDKLGTHLSFNEADLEKLFSTDKREVFIKVGNVSNVYKVSVSKERYACYSSNANENQFIFDRYAKHKNMKLALNEFVNRK